MFNVADHLCKIISVTNVSEKHGKERVPALSIGLYLVGGGELLDMFDVALRGMLYRKPQPKPGELPMEHDGMTELRFPFMRNLAWDRKYAGYLLRFHIGATGVEDVLLAECGLKDIRFTTQEGGSVGVHFKVTAHPKDEIDHGKIGTRLQQELMITLTPPETYVDPGLFGEKDDADDDRNPFEGTDITPLDAGEQNSREGVAWPFPNHERTSIDEPRDETPATPNKRSRRAVTH